MTHSTAARLVPLALLCAVAAIQPACRSRAEPAGATGLLADLAPHVDLAAALPPRVSLAREYRACTFAPSPVGTIPRAVCPGGSSSAATDERVTDVAARADSAGAVPDALHALALTDLLWPGDAGKSLNRSISNMERAARLAPRPAPALADLAAAYLVRAERTQSPRDLLLAAETAGRALEKEPRNAPALFNRALALDLFGLRGEAARAWRGYLAVDSASGWAGEARRRHAAALAVPGPPPPPDSEAAPAELAAYAARDPQGARMLGWDRLLGAWGTAVLQGDAARAGGLLDRAGVLGEALERRGGDASLADAVRAIRARSGDAAATRVLAGAHREYAAGQVLFDEPDYAGAWPRFEAAASGAGASPVLREWARLFQGAALYLGRNAKGAPLLREVSAAADTVRHPALAGRARWAVATTLLRADLRAALEARAAVRLLARAGERENEGAAWGIVSESGLTLGDLEAGYASAYRALGLLRPYRGSVRQHNLLYFLSQSTAADGLPRVALALIDEGVEVATRNGRALYVAEARLARARLLTAAGDFRRAEDDLAVGRALVGRMDDSAASGWFRAELRTTEARIALGPHPAQAVAALDSAIRYFERRRVPVPVRVFPLLIARAEAKLRVGDLTGATADLDRAVGVLEARRAQVGQEPLPAAQRVFERAAMVHLRRGGEGEALAFLDRGRASLAPVGVGRSGARKTGARVRPGEVGVVYARVADTLLIWTVDEDGVGLVRTTVDTVRLGSTIEHVRSSLELRVDDDSVRAGLARLYETLVRPVEGRLGGAETPLVVVADGEIAGVPFAALLDERRGRFLVQDHPLRFATSLADAGRPPPVGGAPDDALLVADPAFAPREHPGLDRLAAAGDEVRDAAARYPRAAVLSGSGATAGAVRAGLARAGVVHYAGHAVFDDARPERSYLVLAPDGAGAGRLTAAELAKLDLRGSRLVVLSACQTIRSGEGRGGGFAGLAGSLLAAGAGGVVGSLWRVEDQRTRALMAQLHREYRATGSGPGALRAAQLHLLRSGSPVLRSPAAWAGFRYAGR